MAKDDGRPGEVSFSVDKQKREPGDVILEIEDVSVINSRGVPGVRNFSLKVHAGEILGLAGVDGNGQSELVEALTGLRAIESGRFLLNSREITGLRHPGTHQSRNSPYP